MFEKISSAICEICIIPTQILNAVYEQEKKHLKRKIRKDFYKVKQKLGLINYMFDDLRFSNLDN